MKLLLLALYRHMGDVESPIKLASVANLSSFSFFARGTIHEHLQFACRMVCQRTSLGQKQTIEHTEEGLPYVIHIYVQRDGLSCVLVSDKEYPLRVAFTLIAKTMAEFEKSNLEAWKRIDQDQHSEPDHMTKELAQFQDPKSADKLMQVQKNLDDIKDIMHKNIEEVLRRGETLETLMAKSQDLSATSLQFYKKAKKQNQCCKAY